MPCDTAYDQTHRIIAEMRGRGVGRGHDVRRAVSPFNAHNGVTVDTKLLAFPYDACGVTVFIEDASSDEKPMSAAISDDVCMFLDTCTLAQWLLYRSVWTHIDCENFARP